MNILNASTHWFFWVQVVSVVASVALLASIIRMIIKIDFFSESREYGLRLLRDASIRKKQFIDEWNRVLSLMATQNPEAWRRAFVIAEQMLHEGLKSVGLLGATTEILLSHATDDLISNSDALKKIRRETLYMIQGERDIELDVIKECLREYRQAFRQMKILV